VSYVDVLGDKSVTYIRARVLDYIVFHLCISCTLFILTCSVAVLTHFVMCGGFIMCGCVYVWGL
jgi:hypothetical protein